MHLAQIDQVSIRDSGPTLTLRLDPGRVLGIFGPAASGKSKFLKCLAGLDKPGQGTVKLSASPVMALTTLKPSRTTPLQIAKESAAHLGAQRVAEVLTLLRLWDVRKAPLGQLSTTQLDAASLIEVFASPSGLMVIDGILDALDPWTFRGVLDLIANRLRSGSAMALVTNRTELAKRMDTLVVLKDSIAVFAGSYPDLERRFPATEITVECHDQPGVRAMTSPFEVELSEDEGLTKIAAAEGQTLAAKLMLEGYGNVKGMILRKPSAAELLQKLFS